MIVTMAVRLADTLRARLQAEHIATNGVVSGSVLAGSSVR